MQILRREIMVSVTQRIKAIKQPRGGYISVKHFNHIQLPIKKELNPDENIYPGLVGITVDYLTRFMTGELLEESFKISLIGAKLLSINEEKRARNLLNKISGLDENSIVCACQLAGYDTVYRAGPQTYKPVELIVPDKSTIENIHTMVNRSLSFIEIHGPITLSGFSVGFESRTKFISSGDGDFLTQDTLWDFKVTKNIPKKEHTLQLLIYYLMGKRSSHLKNYFETLKYLGIYNPRLQLVYKIAISDIPPEVIEMVEKEVIGY